MSQNLHNEISKLEERLLGTWTRKPGLRAAWTPDPAQCFTVRSQAVAEACRAVADLQGNDLGTSVVVALSRSGRLKLWDPGSPIVSDEDLPDPIGALDRWRELRSLAALQKALTTELAGIGPGSNLGELRGRIRAALTVSESESAVHSYSDHDLMVLALQTVTANHGASSLTGLGELDRVTGGMRAGHIWVLGAPTNFGKTSILLALLDHQRELGRRALLVTCEDAPELLATRLLCRRAQLPGDAARDGRLDARQLEQANDEVVNAKHRGPAPVLIDGRGRDVEHLAGDIRAAVRAHGIGLVLVDYLQCIGATKSTQDRRAEINHIARTLTDAIKVSGASGVLASQLTGEDIRESRDVEHAAEVVLIGRKGDDGSHSLFVKKNKTGRKDAVISLDWDGNAGAFRTSDQDPFARDFEDWKPEPEDRYGA